MTDAPDRVIFTHEEVRYSAREILHAKPDAILAQRLLRDVLGVLPNDPELKEAKEASASSMWVRQLEAAQLPDGSWDRFHSQDIKTKTVFRTTEEAIDRAYALGLEPDHVVLTRARQYIQNVLHADAQITDRDEKNEAWPLLVQFIVAGRLAQIDPTNKMLDSFWRYLAEVANQAFASGNYCLEDEAAAYLRLSGIHVPQGFLESQHALWIISSRKLPYQLDRSLVEWLWNKPDGIRYLRAPLAEPKPYHIGYWLRSMNIITRFSSWREITVDTLNNLWEQRDNDGLWDFGSDISRSIDFPLSESWRQSTKRKMDYSTCILVLLCKYFD
ncbi:MAG: hypothetical protein WAM09_01120 [Anaerolineales bacterium]